MKIAIAIADNKNVHFRDILLAILQLCQLKIRLMDHLSVLVHID